MAVAIPFAPMEDAFMPLGCSPRSPSSFQHLSQSPSFANLPPTLTPRRSSYDIKASLAHALPATPPPETTATNEIYAPTRSNRPTPVVPLLADLADVYSGSIIDNFRAALDAIDMDSCEAHGENAFFVCDLAEVFRQHMRWEKELGARVNAHFGESRRVVLEALKLTGYVPAAVKCNPDPRVLHLLAALGLGFDCASQPEIQAVLNLPIPVDASRIIYANPCKAPSFIRHAAANGVNYMTFDNADELAKIKKYHPAAKMVLRILTDDSGSLCRLGVKFGAPLSEARSLLKKAKALGVSVTGISFHCGSGCTNPALFGDAVRRAKWAFDVGREEGFEFDFLDIGGGFEDETFEAIAQVLRDAIEEHFPLDGAGKGVRIIAEPGRYYVSKAFELATNIIARRAAREGTNDESGMNDLVMDEDEEEGEPSVMCESHLLFPDTPR